MRLAFHSHSSAYFIVISLGVIIISILLQAFGFAHGVSTNYGQDRADASGIDDKLSVVTLERQCSSLTILLFALSSCSLDGDEEVHLTSPPAKGKSQLDSDPRLGATGVANDRPLGSVTQPNSASLEWDFPAACKKVFSENDGQICLFTSTTFASGRGISIITTPSIASTFLTLPAVADPGALATINNGTSSTDADEPPCKPTPLPNRGIGTVATRSLRPGDPVTAHTPLLLVLSRAPELLTPPELEPLFRQAAAQLPPASRDMLLALARTSGIEEYMVHDIIQTNLFEVEVGGMKHMAVFPETARVNHDCGAK